jgi:hypothetical protein
MKKIILLFSAILMAPVMLHATGLSFQTINSDVGDILTSSGSELALDATISFGTLDGNLDLSDTTSYTSFDDFYSEFTLLTTGTVIEASPNNVIATLAASTLSSGLNIWLLVESGSEVGVFYIGETPSLNQLVSTPELVTLGTSGAGVAIGSVSGSNLLLSAVPEPSAYAAIAGLLALSWVMVRRRA